MKFYATVFCVMTLCIDVVGYQHFGDQCWHHFLHFIHSEDGGSMALRNVGMLPHHYRCHNVVHHDMNFHRREYFKSRKFREVIYDRIS